MKTFKIVLQDKSLDSNFAKDFALHSLYPNPKVDTTANPKHAGIINLNWKTTGIVIPNGTTRVLYRFSHGYNYIPTAIASYRFDNGTYVESGTLPFQYGALGMIIVDTDQTYFNLKWFSIDIGSVPVPQFLMTLRYYLFAERGYED